MKNHNRAKVIKPVKLEHQVIMDMIPGASSVLDLGCGDGELLHLLTSRKKIRGCGIEIDEQAIRQCVSRGLSVSQQDIDDGLSEYGDKSFNFVILNQSLQQVIKLDAVLKETLRVGKEVIIGFPNFAYYRARLQIFFKGRTPVTPSLPHLWHGTPNLHFLSILDFIEYCHERNYQIINAAFLDGNRIIKLRPNLFAQIGIFLIKNGSVKESK